MNQNLLDLVKFSATFILLPIVYFITKFYIRNLVKNRERELNLHAEQIKEREEKQYEFQKRWDDLRLQEKWDDIKRTLE